MTTATQPGLKSYYPEMNEPRPEAEIEASLGHYGKHWFIRTKLELKGRGITFRRTLTAADVCGPRASELVGMNDYKVTDAAFQKICAQYSVSSESLL